MDVNFSDDGAFVGVSAAQWTLVFAAPDGARTAEIPGWGHVLFGPEGVRVAGWDRDWVVRDGAVLEEPPSHAAGMAPDGTTWVHPPDGMALIWQGRTVVPGATHLRCRGWTCVAVRGRDDAILHRGKVVHVVDTVQRWVPGSRWVQLDGQTVYDLDTGRTRRADLGSDIILGGSSGTWSYDRDSHALTTLDDGLRPTGQRSAPALSACEWSTNPQPCGFDPRSGRVAIADVHAGTLALLDLATGATVWKVPIPTVPPP